MGRAARVQVWLLRPIRATGRRRTIVSLTHGTMANAMPQALGAKKAAPNRQVISLSGDGGLSMLVGDLITAVQEKIPVKIAVFDNSSLGFVELEMKVEGLGGRRDFLPGSQEVKWRDGNPATNATVPAPQRTVDPALGWRTWRD